jgi:hypothetical protein
MDAYLADLNLLDEVTAVTCFICQTRSAYFLDTKQKRRSLL